MAHDDHEDLEDGWSGEEQCFWSDLRMELDRARRASAAELARAESLLAGLVGPVAETPQEGKGAARRAAGEGAPIEVPAFDPPAIAVPATEVVAAAARAAGSAQRLVSIGGGAKTRPSPITPRSFRHFVTAAAAIVVAPQFLAAAALVTAVAASTTYFLTSTTKTLPFTEAVRVLMDEGADDAAREAAQGRVFADLVAALGSLRALDGDEASLRQHADAIRRDLLALLTAEPAFVFRRFDIAIGELSTAIVDRLSGPDQRHESLSRLEAQLRYGISALRFVRPTLSPALREHSDVWLVKLAKLLR